ncbi:MAG: ABC transporter permease [Phycisphaerales bacterium]
MRLLPFEYGVRNLGRSRVRLALSVFGSTLVVLLVLAAGAFVRGMDRSLRASGGEHNVILLGAGSEESIQRSEIKASVGSLASASIAGIATRLGVAYASEEVHVDLQVRTRPDEEDARLVLIRGVTPRALLVHDTVQMVEGRPPEGGRDEIMVGALVSTRLGVSPARLSVGNTVWIEEREWTIAGRFVAPGTVMEAEAWMTLTDVKELTRRDTDSCVVLTLGEAEFADVDTFAKSRLDLELVAMPEADYYAKLAAFFRPIRVVTWITAGLIALGGLLGGLNTMYAAFASRVRELGMLQCLGFRRGAIVASLTQESVLAASAGSLLACLIAVLTLDGVAVRFSMGAFGLSVDAGVVALGLLAGLALGMIGALPPALRALRLPIPEALKAA